MKESEGISREPFGRVASRIGKMFLGKLQKRLSGLEIERNFYPLLLIHAAKGKLTQQELADKLMIDKVQVVRIVDYLSENGYAERVQHAEDRRKYALRATEKAEKSIPKIQKAINKTSDVGLKGLSDQEVEQLYTMLMRIEKNLSK